MPISFALPAQITQCARKLLERAMVTPFTVLLAASSAVAAGAAAEGSGTADAAPRAGAVSIAFGAERAVCAFTRDAIRRGGQEDPASAWRSSVFEDPGWMPVSTSSAPGRSAIRLDLTGDGERLLIRRARVDRGVDQGMSTWLTVYDVGLDATAAEVDSNQSRFRGRTLEAPRSVQLDTCSGAAGCEELIDESIGYLSAASDVFAETSLRNKQYNAVTIGPPVFVSPFLYESQTYFHSRGLMRADAFRWHAVTRLHGWDQKPTTVCYLFERAR